MFLMASSPAYTSWSHHYHIRICNCAKMPKKNILLISLQLTERSFIGDHNNIRMHLQNRAGNAGGYRTGQHLF